MRVAVSGLVDLDARHLVDDPALTGLLPNWVFAHLSNGATEGAYGTFSTPSGDVERFTASEDSCGSRVSVGAGAAQLPALSDASCSLLRLVAGLLPAAVVGTRDAVDSC
jgi:hypothetical protein